MTLFLQVCGAVLLSVVLVLTLKNHSKDIGLLLAIGMCIIAALAAMQYLRPVIDFLKTLENVGGLDSTMVTTLLKVTGIGLITEIANLICKDSGNESMGKTLQLVGTAVILWMSVPLFTTLIELIQRILGEL